MLKLIFADIKIEMSFPASDTYDEYKTWLYGWFSTSVSTHDDPRDRISKIAPVGGQTISGVDFGSEPKWAFVFDFEGSYR